MADKALPTPAELRQLLRYDPSSGKLFWRERSPDHFNHARDAVRWNARHAGKEAFISVHGQGYRQGQINRRTIKAHRVIWAMEHGCWPQVIDHIDGDVLNNRLENLRDVTQADNCRNARLRKDNKSGRAGIRWHKANRKWVAFLGNIYLGTFEHLSDAEKTRDEAERSAGYEARHGRR